MSGARMSPNDQSPPGADRAGHAAERPRLWRYLGRAARLRCPECGRHPIFVPPRRVRSAFDWLCPLDGCPRCGFAYEREEGYFLLATWVVNYGLIGAAGLAAGLALQAYTRMSTGAIMAVLVVAMPVASISFARHAKAIWLAIDHYFDPEGGKGRGGK
jgi:uncharacterized protein (DUF983 family)